MISFGGFLNSNFWHTYRQHGSPSIEDILNKPDCTVEKLLDDEDIIQEFKTQNQKLLDYFTHDKMKKLIDFITVMPPEDATKARGHKYPYLALEIFNCEIHPLLEKFFEAPEPKQEEETKDETIQDEIEDEVLTGDLGAAASESGPSDQEKSQEAESTASSEEQKEEEKTEEPASTEETKTEEPTDASTTQEESEPQGGQPTLQRQNTPVPGSPEEVKALLEEEDKQAAESKPAEPATEPEAEESKETPAAEAKEPASEKPEASEAAAAEPEEEKSDAIQDEPENEGTESTEGTTQMTMTTDAASEKSEEEQISKYMLLNRLFKFIQTGDDDEPVNPVLAGYFSKIVQLLINRKQKQIVPYIMANENKVVETLLKHVYSRSVAEVIHRLLLIVESNFDDELSAKISLKKHLILSSLIDKLGSDNEDETVMNAAFILQDILESKSFFQTLTKRVNMQKMYDIAFNAEKIEKDSCFVTQGLIARFVQQFNDRQKQQDNEFDFRGEDDDDIIVNEMSDEENEDSKNKNNAAVIELLTQMVEPLKSIIERDPLEPIPSSFNQNRSLPLGRTKLRAVELLQAIVSLKKQPIIAAVNESGLMANVLALIEKHPWNNMVQLKGHQIFEDVLTSDITAQEKLDFIKTSGATSALVRMAETPEVNFASGKKIRNGYMGFVIKLANLIVKNKMTFEGTEGEADVLTQDWNDFVANELESSNERNARNLGGRPTSTQSDDDETNQFDVNMDNIMKRFKCFNTVMQNNSSTDEEDETNEPEGEGDASNEENGATQEEQKIEVVLPEATRIDSKFADSGYWKVDAIEDELDDLLADYE